MSDNIPATMKAAVATEGGLAIRDIPCPRPKGGEILVKVRMAGLNRADLNRTPGPPDKPQVPGIDWSGDVVAVGPEAQGFKVGDAVMSSGPAGGYAEYACADWGRALPLPKGWGYDRGASLTLTLQTAHDAVMTRGRLRKGENVLVLGGTSGVGLLALQIAKLKGAGVIIGSSTHPDKRARLGEYGATTTIDTGDKGWVDQVMKATGGKGVDVIVDMLAGPLVNQAFEAAAVEARMVNVGRMAGRMAEIDCNLQAAKRIEYIGVTFRSRTLADVRDLTRRLHDDLWPQIENQTIGQPIDRIFPLAEADAAQAYMRSNSHFGKLLLKVA